MTSYLAINPNKSHDSRVHDQLLFLEKLRYNEECEIESSFVHSNQFNSILKQFKREKQKIEDEKKWETFLQQRLQQEIPSRKPETHVCLPISANQALVHNNVTSHKPNLTEHDTCDIRGEYENNWLNDSYVQLETNFHNNQENENKCQMSLEMNDSSCISFNNEFQNGIITYTDDDYYGRSHTCQNEGNSVMEMHYNCSNYKNEEIVNSAIQLHEQNICDNNCTTEALNITQQKPGSSGNEKIFDESYESGIVHESKGVENKATTVEVGSESVTSETQKKEVISSSTSGSVPINLNKRKENKPAKDESLSNGKNLLVNNYISEPEESYCKNVAKKIQDIPGVDNELRKVEDIRIKMSPVLANIKIAIAKNVNSPLSSDEDLERIKQRTLEFGARFKRNYLYRTNCQVNKLKEMLPSPILISKKSKILLVIQKLTAVHHAVIQALQVIEKQLQTISIFGKTQELICSFYNCIYELTLTLKPFYGYLKTQVLDEVEKLLVETIELLKDLKLEEKFAIPNKSKQKKNQLKSSTEPPPWMKKSAALARLKFGPPIRVRKRKSNQEQNPKILESKQSKDSIISDQGEKWEQEQDMVKQNNFMMSVKQRPGAKLRQSKIIPVKTEEPKTMIEIISREGSAVDNILKQVIQTVPTLENNQQFSITETVISEDNYKPENVKTFELPKKSEPSNVKLICIKREDHDNKESEIIETNTCNKDENIIQWDDLLKYKRNFKKYKKNNPLYEKNTLNTVVR